MDQPMDERDVVIGADVWLGARVVVGAGVEIGEGSVVGRPLLCNAVNSTRLDRGRQSGAHHWPQRGSQGRGGDPGSQRIAAGLRADGIGLVRRALSILQSRSQLNDGTGPGI